MVLQMPTGGGKTVVAAQIIKQAEAKHRRSLFLAPRRELIYQASRKLASMGVHHGIIMAGEPMNVTATTQVASFDTLNARAMQRDRMPLPKADLVIVDEARLSIAKRKQELIDSYPDAYIIGLDATPARPDGRGLGEIYDDLVLSWSMGRMIEAGYLVPARYVAPSKPDLDRVAVAAGDYVISTRKDGKQGLRDVMDAPKLIGDIADNWERWGSDKQTVIFCCDRRHARHVCEEFQRRGHRAEYVDGETPNDERAGIFERVESKETQVLVNVFVATYGLDIPSLECAVMARPTRSLVLYLQIAGRVLRPAPGKSEALIIDHSGVIDAHGFVDDEFPWSLDGSKKIQEERKAQKEDRKEPKEMTCPKCATVFRSRRDCPNCGYQMVPAGDPVPYYEADLEEVTDPKRLNRMVPASEKRRFYEELLYYADEHGKKRGWAAHTYRSRFGVWPNAFRDAEPAVFISLETSKWIQHRNIAYAKRMKKMEHRV